MTAEVRGRGPMIRALALFAALAASPAAAITFDRYHSQAEIAEFLRATADERPELAAVHVLGESEQGREVAYLVLTKSADANPPALYFNGTHHGNEWSSTESVLALIDHLVAHADDAAESALLEHYAIYLQPL